MDEAASGAWLSPPPPVERYFSKHYGKGMAPCLETRKSEGAGRGEDICVVRHHNGICVVCVSPSHPIVTEKLGVSSVSFRDGLRKVSGKRKRGGSYMEPETRVASISCDNGSTYCVMAGVRGVLVEVNEGLAKDPTLVGRKPLSCGYIAVVLPKHGDRKDACRKLLEEDPCVQG